jgi:hypothetical protein
MMSRTATGPGLASPPAANAEADADADDGPLLCACPAFGRLHPHHAPALVRRGTILAAPRR